ncbi:hypothetical protein ACHWQZ_G012974 [Mnemiopsis leidyi]
MADINAPVPPQDLQAQDRDQQPPLLPPRNNQNRPNPALQFIRAPPILKINHDLDTYLRRFDAYTQSIGAAPEEIPHILINSLDDEVMQFIERHLIENITLDELVRVLRRELGFSRVNREEFKTKLRRTLRARNEEVRSFYSKLWTMAKKAYPDNPAVREANLRDAFIANLQDSSISARLRERPEMTNEQLLDLAVTLLHCKQASLSRQADINVTYGLPSPYEQALDAPLPVREPIAAREPDTNTTTTHLEQKMDALLGMMANVNDVNQNSYRYNGDRRSVGLDREYNHQSPTRNNQRQYHARQPNNNQQQGSYRNQGSHPGRNNEIPNKKVTFNDKCEIFETTSSAQASPENLASNGRQDKALTINSATDCNLPYVPGILQGLKVKCLIDTGSSANILNSKCLKELGNLNLDPTSVRLCGINKSSVNVHGECNINLTIGGKLCPIDVIVADIYADIVLGNPFIKEFSVLVNLSKGQLIIPDYPATIVPINNVQLQANPSQDIDSLKTLPHSNRDYLVQCACSADVVIPSHHAAWIDVEIKTDATPETILVFSEIPSNSNETGQLLNLEPNSKSYKMFVVNHTDFPLDLEAGNIVATADLTPLHQQFQLPFDSSLIDNKFPLQVNGSYNLSLTDDDRKLRWVEICKILRVNTWAITDEQKQIALNALKQFEFVFAMPNEPLGLLKDYYHEIDVGDASPISMRPRPLSEDKLNAVKVIVDDLLARGLIRPSRSPWSAPIVLAKKPGDGSYRLCCDFRRLNGVTVRDSFPLPNINHMLSTLKHSKFFSTMDLASGFHQIRLTDSAIPLTAFATPDALYEWLVLPFGVCNGPPSFVRAMSNVLKLPKSEALVYFDDILTLGKSFEVHLQNLLKVLSTLQNANLKVKISKCTLFALKIDFLGHVISEEGVACSPEKIECIKNIPIPDNPKSLRSYLGVFSYYRKFCPKYSEIAAPLFKLAVADKKNFKWTEDANSAFLELQTRLSTPPILTLPTDDDKFILTTDASGIAIGCILTVDRPEGRKVICYASHLLEASRRSYPATKRELYSVVFYVQKFRMYLLPREFVVESDHNCLRYIANFKDPPAIIARWLAILSDYKFTIVHRPATNSLIKVADFLSRPSSNQNSLPIATTPDDNFLQTPPDDVENLTKHTKPTITLNNILHDNKTTDDVISDHQITNDVDDHDHVTNNVDNDQITNNVKSDHVTNNFNNNHVTNKTDDNHITSSVFPDHRTSNNVINDYHITYDANSKTTHDVPVHATTIKSKDDNDKHQTANDDEKTQDNNRQMQSSEPEDQVTDISDDKFHDADCPENTRNDETQSRILISQYITTIKDSQNTDKNITLLKKRLVNDNHATINDISSDPPAVKFYWSQKSRLHLQDGILYFAAKTPPDKYRLIVPHSMIKELLKLAHDDQTAGHRSAVKMLPLLKNQYHWFKMRSDIELYVKQCISCGAHKKPRANRPRAPLYNTKVSSRFERLSVDFAGPFQKTARGNRFILLGVCCFTKFGFCIPMSNTDSEHVARTLIDRWICYFGVPIQIHNDSGSNLISDLMKHLYRLLNIKPTNSLPYVPQQNGQSERFVSTMRSMLCHFGSTKPRQWDLYAPLVCLAYNSQTHASTKFTPHEMVMGPDPVRLPLDFAWGAPPIVEDIDEPDYVAFLRDAMYDIHEFALNHLNSTLATSKDRFDKGQYGKPYKKDDLVWRLKGKFDTGSRKFQKRYDGIFIVLEKLTNTSYLIKHLKTHNEEIVHFNRLKKAYLNPLTLKALLQQLDGNQPKDPKDQVDLTSDQDEPLILGYRQPHAPVEPPIIDHPEPIIGEMPIHDAPQAEVDPPIIDDQPLPDVLIVPRRRRAPPAIPIRRTYNLRPRQ